MNELLETAQTLKANLAGLPAKDLGFANSLLDQFAKRGKLSEKQQYWLVKLADAAQGIPDFTKPEPDKVHVGTMTGLITIFEAAAQKLKKPSFTLQTDSGKTVRLSRAGAESKNPGAIYVKHGFEKFLTYVGKVMPNGEFVAASTLQEKHKPELVDLLRQMARHPAETAGKYGKLTGKCCFCSLPLTDPKSTAVGYGKTCAGHYQLPWGEKSA